MDQEFGHTDLEGGGGLCDVRVADNHVHTAISTGISQRLVTGVDDRARTGRGGGDGIPHLIGTLGELQSRGGRARVDPPVSDQDLTRHEECDQRIGDLAEVASPVQEVVFVASVRVALRV